MHGGRAPRPRLLPHHDDAQIWKLGNKIQAALDLDAQTWRQESLGFRNLGYPSRKR